MNPYLDAEVSETGKVTLKLSRTARYELATLTQQQIKAIQAFVYIQIRELDNNLPSPIQAIIHTPSRFELACTQCREENI